MIPRLLAGEPRWTVCHSLKQDTEEQKVWASRGDMSCLLSEGHRGTQPETGYMNSREFWSIDKDVEVNRIQKALKP